MRNYLSAMTGNLGGSIDPRRTYAQQLLAQGASTSPKNAGEGLSQLAKSALGMLLMKRSMAQESDMWKGLNAQQPDVMRQPTEAEAYANNPALRGLQLNALTGGLGQEQTVTAPLPDDQLRQQGGIPGTLDKISRYKAGLSGDPVGSDDYEIKGDQALSEGIALQEQNLQSEMDQARKDSTIARPRDFGAELQSGMESYRDDESNQVMQDKMSQMDWMQQQLRGMEGNPFAMRMMQNLMFQKMAQGQADRVYDRGLADRRQDTALAQDIQADQFATTTALKARQLAQAGFTLSKTTLPNGMEQRVWLNRETGESKLEGEPYDPNMKSEAAQAQDIESKKAGRTTWATVPNASGVPVQRSSSGMEKAVPAPPMSKGMIEVDKKFGKFYADHYAQGGVHDALSNVGKLDGVISQLNAVADGTDKVNNLTGPVIGLRPSWMDAMVNPQQRAAQDAVEEVVQRNLRVVLGAQFTAKEGERLIERAYNPKLEEAENAIRVQRLLNAMRSTLQAQLKAGRYFEKNGTLQGWEGSRTTLSMSDLESIVEGSDMLKTGEDGNVSFDRRKGDPLSPEKRKRMEELKRKARGQ